MPSFATVSLLVLAAAVRGAPRDDRAEVEALLDRFHAAASRADEGAYFACLDADGVFLGTDPEERWTVPDFRAYAHEHFAAGRGWTYVPRERHVTIGARARTAWFDEVLRNEKYGLCRGTGTCVKVRGTWRIAQYSLTFLVPNDAAPAVVAAIGGTGAR